MTIPLIPLPDGQQTALLQTSCCLLGWGEGLLGVRASHQASKGLEISGKQLSEDTGPGEEVTHHLKGGQADFSMVLMKSVHQQLVSCPDIGIRLPSVQQDMVVR